MSWVVTCSLFVLCCVLGLMFFIFMPKPQVFFDSYLSELKHFSTVHDDITQELDNNPCDWPVIPIYGRGTIYNNNYPVIYNLLRSVPNVRYAGIINIKPKFEQMREYGFDEVSNHTIRHFYTIKQSSHNKSGIWIDGEKRFFNEQEWILGDMAREHALFNKNKDSYTVVLFVDIDKPATYNIGRSPNDQINKDEVLKVFEKFDVNNAMQASDVEFVEEDFVEEELVEEELVEDNIVG